MMSANSYWTIYNTHTHIEVTNEDEIFSYSVMLAFTMHLVFYRDRFVRINVRANRNMRKLKLWWKFLVKCMSVDHSVHFTQCYDTRLHTSPFTVNRLYHLCVQHFLGIRYMCWYFLPLTHIEMTRAVEILPHESRGTTHLTIPWLLIILHRIDRGVSRRGNTIASAPG